MKLIADMVECGSGLLKRDVILEHLEYVDKSKVLIKHILDNSCADEHIKMRRDAQGIHQWKEDWTSSG